MKRRNIMMALLLLAAGIATAQAQNGKVMKVWSGRSFTIHRINSVDSVQFATLVSDIVLSADSIVLEKGETFQLNATPLPEEADDKTVAWKCDNTFVATVDENGLVTAEGRGTAAIICTSLDGSEVSAECKVTVNAEIVSDEHEWVDLGLPSGTLWATCNIGASKPEEYGDYFAWGETEAKETYYWENYILCDETETSINKYCTDSQYGTVDDKTELEAEDDVATVKWGENWQMPSKEQIDELLNSSNTTTEFVFVNGVKGCKFTSTANGNSIFLPATGHRYWDRTGLVGSYGKYWSRTLSSGRSDFASYLEYSATSAYWGEQRRFYGMAVRPVRR